jgi:fucose 4-O-acetylase-like acetyltransferase
MGYTEKSLPRIKWIDLLRGFCMMAILWFHTEVYFTGQSLTPYELYVGNVLAVFFFLSGYLMLGRTLDIKQRISSIILRLIIPYFVFTTIIAVSKAILVHDNTTWKDIIISIVSGHASWFIAALILSQLLFILFLRITKGKIIWLSIIAICCLVLSYFIGNTFKPYPYYYEQNLWHLNEALLACFVLFTGYLYRKYESYFNNISILLSLFIIYIFLKIYIIYTDAQFILGPIIVSNYPIFIVDLLCAVLLMAGIFKHLPSVRFIEWTGSHSLVYYFLCGAVPFIVSRLFHTTALPRQSYLSILVVFCVVYIVSTLLTKIIYMIWPTLETKVSEPSHEAENVASAE